MKRDAKEKLLLQASVLSHHTSSDDVRLSLNISSARHVTYCFRRYTVPVADKNRRSSLCPWILSRPLIAFLRRHFNKALQNAEFHRARCIWREYYRKARWAQTTKSPRWNRSSDQLGWHSVTTWALCYWMTCHSVFSGTGKDAVIRRGSYHL